MMFVINYCKLAFFRLLPDISFIKHPADKQALLDMKIVIGGYSKGI